MLKTVKTTFCIIAFNLICSQAFAEAFDTSFQEHLEEMIAMDNNFDDVIVYYPKGTKVEDNLDIIEVTYDKSSRFKAVVRAHNGNEFNIIGRFEEATLIPVLIEAINANEEIDADNIAFMKTSKSRGLAQVFKTKDSIVGRFAKHKIIPGKPIHFNDLGLETLVQRNQTVKMIYQKDNLFIETLGMSIDAGGKDEIIRVKNLDSSKIVRAKVKDPETVLVNSESHSGDEDE
jgi:flagella basal body P-ring formation protein FlgA